MSGSSSAERVYVVTDIEVDAFVPGAHSMLAIASVAVTAAGEQVGEFERRARAAPRRAAPPGHVGVVVRRSRHRCSPLRPRARARCRR